MSVSMSARRALVALALIEAADDSAATSSAATDLLNLLTIDFDDSNVGSSFSTRHKIYKIYESVYTFSQIIYSQPANNKYTLPYDHATW